MLKAANLEKWKQTKDNLQNGDIVLMLDSPNKIGSYQTAKVIQTYPDERGIVRKVKVSHTTPTGVQNEIDGPSAKLSKLTTQVNINDDTDADDDVHDLDDDDFDDDMMMILMMMMLTMILKMTLMMHLKMILLTS